MAFLDWSVQKAAAIATASFLYIYLKETGLVSCASSVAVHIEAVKSEYVAAIRTFREELPIWLEKVRL